MHQNKRSVAIFTPFPQILGGGEKYIFHLAESFSERGFSVYIQSPFYYDIPFMAEQYNLKLTNCSYSKTSTKDFFLPSFSKEYDYFFSLSNHIIPPIFGKGKYNTLIIQFPFPYPFKKLGDKLQYFLQYFKLLTYQRVICYSHYSEKWIINKLPLLYKKMQITVLYPPINFSSFIQNKKKKNVILVVGRFFAGDHNKKHIELINIFKKLHRIAPDWELHIAGYLYNDEKSKQYYLKVKNSIGKYPIYVHPSLLSNKLISLFKEAKIFWHAAGYKDNLEYSPEKAEHFGIVIAEAMSSGAIPIAINAGGIPEIIVNGENGFLWTTEDELISITAMLIGDNKKIERIRSNTITSGRNYDVSNFNKKLKQLYI